VAALSFAAAFTFCFHNGDRFDFSPSPRAT
jgi:hypothetical protein